MDDVVIDEVGKRRLPPWMLNVNSNSDSSEVVPVREKLNKEEKERKDDTDSSFLVNRGKEERTRRLRLGEKDTGNEGEGGIDIEGGLQKKKKRPKKRIEGLGRAVQEAVPLKKCKLKGDEVGNGEEKRASSSPSEEDGELTVDDLMSIAEEYIKKANSGKEHQREATAGPKLDKQVSAASVFFGNESRVSTEASQRSEVPGTTATSSTVSNFTSSIHKDRYHMPNGGQETSAGKDVGGYANQRRTGDPTQDMLDLFLGPLLTKPQIEERKPEFVEEDVTLDSKLSKNEVLQETVVPVATKKKSSLKDKVTMFLG